jgi:uncharacterized membrane protein YhaH (DUF805 family)
MRNYFKWFYFAFDGRTGRRPYWLYFVLPFFLLGIAFGIATRAAGLSERAFIALLLLLAVPSLWTYIAVGVKRFHDFDRSAWWLLLGFVPLINWILMIGLGLIPGTRGANSYGPDPRETRQVSPNNPLDRLRPE